MSYLKKFAIVLVALLIPFGLASAAQADDETVTASTNVTPNGGKFFKEVGVSSNLDLQAVVTPSEASIMVTPLKNVKFTLPRGLTFKPNNKVTPVCTDQMLNPDSNFLATPAAVVAACPKSVIGTGNAEIYLGRFKAAPRPAILIAFNAGKSNSGNPKLKIYGYAPVTNVGIIMTGELNRGVLDIAVPVLSSDSAVGNFSLGLPGERLDEPSMNINVKGSDPNYVQARCAASPLRTNAVFQLGTRDFSTGQPTGPTITVDAPESTQNCTGAAGKARLGGVKVKGPNAVKNRRVGTFRVTVRNPGTASAKNVVVTTNRGGRARAGVIAPGTAKTVRVKVRIRGKKNRKAAVRFVAKSGKVRAAAVKRVRVR